MWGFCSTLYYALIPVSVRTGIIESSDGCTWPNNIGIGKSDTFVKKFA